MISDTYRSEFSFIDPGLKSLDGCGGFLLDGDKRFSIGMGGSGYCLGGDPSRHDLTHFVSTLPELCGFGIQLAPLDSTPI